MTDLISAVSATDFDSAREFIKAALLAKNPNLDLTPGSALDALLVTPEAYAAAQHLAQLEQLALSSSLTAIADNLVSVSDAAVDALASNYFVTRRSATNATGPVRIVVDSPVPYVLPSGFRFTNAAGLGFVTTQVIRAFPPGAVAVSDANPSTRRMVQRADGLYEFTVTVQSEQTGAVGRLIGGTVLTIEAPLAGMVSAMVATDFVGGDSAETNAELVARLQEGITAKVLAGPEHIAATLSAEFPGCRVSVVGVGSPLMKRDRLGIFALPTGGKQDLWVRTSDAARLKTVQLTGTVLDATAKTILLPIPHAESVGCYRVKAIRKAGAVQVGGDVPSSTTVSIDLSEPYRPTLPTTNDARYSAYANLVCIFTDTTGDTMALNAQRAYDVDLLYMPDIAGVHAFVTDAAIRPAGQDVLVRAAVPCEVAVQATVRLPATTATPDLVELKTAIVSAINALPFGTASLSAFVVHRAIASLLPKGDVVDTSLRGTVIGPFDNVQLPASRDLALPDDAVHLLGAINTFFSCSIENVELTVVSR